MNLDAESLNEDLRLRPALLIVNFIEVVFINWQYVTGAALAALALVFRGVNVRDALRH